jgi:cytochrome P450
MNHKSPSPTSTKAPESRTPTIRIETFDQAREVLRSGNVRQAGFKAELLERFGDRAHAPVLFQEGEAHQKQRSATARFFAPRVVTTRYRDLMERMSDELVERFRAKGRARLDDLSLELAVAVAAEIIGLTNSPLLSMANRLNRFFSPRNAKGRLGAFVGFFAGQYRTLMFYLFDVRPAIGTRRSKPQEDVISHLIGEGYSNREILTECLTYAAAGMATTREFIVMAAMQFMERDDLRARFLEAKDAGQTEILEELLRLDPVISLLKRRAKQDVVLATAEGTSIIPAQTLIEIDVRASNRDESAAGADPNGLKPDRVRGAKVPSSLMSFGDGPHRCPGASVALQEAAIFLDRLMRLSNLRLEHAPTRRTNPVIASYELREAIISCGVHPASGAS